MNTPFDLMEERIISYWLQFGPLTLWIGRMDNRMSRLRWNHEKHIQFMQSSQGYALNPYHIYYLEGGNYLDEPSHDHIQVLFSS